MIEAKILADSIHNGKRITSMQIKAPKFIDAQFEKHRLISSNSSSDRAIPFHKLCEADYFVPKDVRANEAGMQGTDNVANGDLLEFQNSIKDIREYTVYKLSQFDGLVHKQHLNRYLLGFTMQDKVITATEWDNFFALRLHSAADPVIYELALKMSEALQGSNPKELEYGEWHLPYVDNYDNLNIAIKCSVARCARVSYKTHDNKEPSIERDVALYKMLLDSKHLSCFEHQATPIYRAGATALDMEFDLWSGNFKGWTQLRHDRIRM